MKFEKILSRFGWLVVMTAALSISAWSLWYIGVHYGLPPVLAGLVSACYDGGAIVCAMLALSYARSQGDSGLAPRIGVFLLGGISAYLNAQHATLAGNHSLAARLLYACPPVISVATFELQTRWLRRGALKRAGRIPERLPTFGRWAWILFPVRTLSTTRHIVASRLDAIEQRTTGITRAQINSGGDGSVSYEHGTEITTTVVRQWARANGIQVSDRGPVPAEVRAGYLRELTAANPGETSSKLVSRPPLTSPDSIEGVPRGSRVVPGPRGGVPPGFTTVPGPDGPVLGEFIEITEDSPEDSPEDSASIAELAPSFRERQDRPKAS